MADDQLLGKSAQALRVAGERFHFERHWRSSLPLSGLNFTSTKPPARETFFLTHHGNVPRPVCCSTFFPLGAVGSAPTAHLELPEPVTPASQLSGSAPGLVLSKFSVSACAANAVAQARMANTMLFMRRSYGGLITQKPACGAGCQGGGENAEDVVNRAQTLLRHGSRNRAELGRG